MLVNRSKMQDGMKRLTARGRAGESRAFDMVCSTRRELSQPRHRYLSPDYWSTQVDMRATAYLQCLHQGVQIMGTPRSTAGVRQAMPPSMYSSPVRLSSWPIAGLVTSDIEVWDIMGDQGLSRLREDGSALKIIQWRHVLARGASTAVLPRQRGGTSPQLSTTTFGTMAIGGSLLVAEPKPWGRFSRRVCAHCVSTLLSGI